MDDDLGLVEEEVDSLDAHAEKEYKDEEDEDFGFSLGDDDKEDGDY